MENRLLAGYHNSLQHFKEFIPKHLKQTEFTLQSMQTKTKLTPLIKNIKFQCQKFLTKSDMHTSIQTDTKFYLFLFKHENQNLTSLIAYQFLKSNGQSKSIQFKGIQSHIVTAKAIFYKDLAIKRGKKGQVIQESQHKMVLLMGSKDGFLKILQFPKIDQIKQLQVVNIKIDHLPLIYIKVLDPDQFYMARTCLIMTQSNRVVLVSLDIQKILAIFQPTIIQCDHNLSLSVDEENKYFIQVTKGGFIIFWSISQKIMDVIRKTSEQSCRTKEIQRNKSAKIQNRIDIQEQNFHFTEYSQKFMIKECIPLSIFHAATIQGLFWAQLCGDLIAVVTKKGYFKLIAVDNQKANDCQHIVLMQYLIKDGQYITDIRYFPQDQEIFIIKFIQNDKNNSDLKKPKYLNKVRQYNSQRIYNQERTNENGKSTHVNNFSRRKDEPNINEQKSRYFQRIKYNSDMEVHTIDNVEPQCRITDGFLNLEISEDRDIFFLRTNENFLIGSSTLFYSNQK